MTASPRLMLSDEPARITGATNVMEILRIAASRLGTLLERWLTLLGRTDELIAESWIVSVPPTPGQVYVPSAPDESSVTA